MHKKTILILILSIFVLVGCQQVQPQTQQPTWQYDSVVRDQEKQQPDVVTESTPPHPVSLQALAQQEFDGRDLEVGRVLADNQWYTRYYIEYKSGDLIISGIMNVPKGEGPFPVLVLNHGYIDPAVYTNGRGLKREQDYFARNGYIVIHPDYRNHAFSSDVEDNHMNLRLGYTEDVINAVYAVRESDFSYFDADAIGMLGHSMGGGITLNIITSQPNLVDAAVLYAPVSSEYRDNFNKWTRERSEEAEQIVSEYGTMEENPTFWDNISPINFLTQIQTPIMLHHGTADDSTPIAWSDKLAAALEADEKNITYHMYEGAPHEFISDWQLFMERSLAFYDTHLK